jgi:hypothetical protein
MSIVAPEVTEDETITNVHPLERSTENALPAPSAVTDESNVFLSSVRRLIYIYIISCCYEESCTPVPPLPPPIPILGRRRAVSWAVPLLSFLGCVCLTVLAAVSIFVGGGGAGAGGGGGFISGIGGILGWLKHMAIVLV